MALVDSEERIFTVYANNCGGVTIQEITLEHGGDVVLDVPMKDVKPLIAALQAIVNQGEA